MAFKKFITIAHRACLCAAALLASLFFSACATSNQSPNQTQQTNEAAPFAANPISYGAWDDQAPAATNLAVLQIETQTKRVVAGRMRATIINGLAIPNGTILTNGAHAKWEWVLVPAGEAIVTAHAEEHHKRIYRYGDLSGICKFEPRNLYRLVVSDKTDRTPTILLEKIGPADFGPNSPYFPVARDAIKPATQ